MSDGKELKIGGRMKYHGWLIVREEEYVYLVFTPDNVDYPERGYEDWETDSLAEAKDWIDNYDSEEEEEA